MAVFAGEMSGILIQGITGRIGESFARRMVESKTPLVGGVTPGRGGGRIWGVEMFDSVADAVRATGAGASLIVVPPIAVLDAVIEAASAGIRLISVYTEHVPVHDALRAQVAARAFGAHVVGPNAAGIASPSVGNMSDIDSDMLVPGSIGIVSKSGTLVYEVIEGLRQSEVGVSSLVCLGGDEVVGTTYEDVLPMFAADPQTEVVVLIGEIGGGAELDAAQCWRRLGEPKPLVAYVAGWAAPARKRMGHAGAIVVNEQGGAELKVLALQEAGAVVVTAVTELASAAVLALHGAEGIAEGAPIAGEPRLSDAGVG